MKALFLISALGILASCQSTKFLSEKDHWIAISTMGGERIYYCERVSNKSEVIPLCTEALQVNDQNTKLKYIQNAIPAEKK
jgi:hypothetical protein